MSPMLLVALFSLAPAQNAGVSIKSAHSTLKVAGETYRWVRPGKPMQIQVNRKKGEQLNLDVVRLGTGAKVSGTAEVVVRIGRKDKKVRVRPPLEVDRKVKGSNRIASYPVRHRFKLPFSANSVRITVTGGGVDGVGIRVSIGKRKRSRLALAPLGSTKKKIGSDKKKVGKEKKARKRRRRRRGRKRSPKVEVAKTDTAKTDVAKTDKAKTDVAKTDAAKTDAAKTDATKADVAKTDAAKTDAAKTDATKADVAKTDAAKTDVAKTDAAKTDVAKTDAAKTDVAKTDAAKTDAAKTDVAKTDVAKTDAAKTDLAKTDAAKTGVAAGEKHAVERRDHQPNKGANLTETKEVIIDPERPDAVIHDRVLPFNMHLGAGASAFTLSGGLFPIGLHLGGRVLFGASDGWLSRYEVGLGVDFDSESARVDVEGLPLAVDWSTQSARFRLEAAAKVFETKLKLAGLNLPVDVAAVAGVGVMVGAHSFSAAKHRETRFALGPTGRIGVQGAVGLGPGAITLLVPVDVSWDAVSGVRNYVPVVASLFLGYRLAL